MSNFTFTGFSSISADNGGDKTLHDLKLIEQDLYVRFHVLPGEQVMRPERGCTIWYKLEEPFTQQLVDSIKTEAIRICELDPRLSVVSVNVIQYDLGIRVEIVLNYIPYNSIGTFIVDFNNRQSALSASLGDNS
jgi:phage baseplate assembly protein W